jgi:hypothetical protein
MIGDLLGSVVSSTGLMLEIIAWKDLRPTAPGRQPADEIQAINDSRDVQPAPPSCHNGTARLGPAGVARAAVAGDHSPGAINNCE